jgi:hypothetical protein
MSELLEEQELTRRQAGLLEDVGAVGATALAVGELGLNPAADAAAGALDTAAIGGAVADTAATATADAATADAAAGAESTAAGAESTIGSEASANAGEAGADGGSSGGSSLWQRAKGFASDQWDRLSPNQQKAIKALAPGASSAAGSELSKGSGPSGSSGSVPTQGPYGGGTGGGQPVRVAPMLVGASKKANTEAQILSEVNNMSRMLELILENLCGCGEPTAGKFEGMPHCVPGSGCATNVARSATNPTGDCCCSCGNPNCSGSFHGQPICAPGQGCNDHWEPGQGRKWNPSMESPQEKIEDHDNWAMETNHGEREMPKTSWE